MRWQAPAKVNLYLRVGARRPDGYHDVDTVLQTLEIGDEVEVSPADRFSFSCEPDLGLPPEANLAHRAATVLAEAVGRPLDVAVRIAKRLPAGAGLGGGSSDAAAVLRALVRLWDLRDTGGLERRVAVSLGADVPFFLEGGCALYGGRGDALVRRLPWVPMDVVLVWPGEPVPTPAAYAAFDRMLSPAAPDPSTLLAALEGGEPGAVMAAVHNDLGEAAVGLVPATGHALALLRGADGALGAAVCGSGAGVFGIFADRATATAGAVSARERGWWAEETRTTPAYSERAHGEGVA